MTRGWAWTVLEKVASLDVVGQRSPVVVLSGGATLDRRAMLHGTYARLHAAAAGCRQQHATLTAERAPHPQDEAYLLGAELAGMAAARAEGARSGQDPVRTPAHHGRRSTRHWPASTRYCQALVRCHPPA